MYLTPNEKMVFDKLPPAFKAEFRLVKLELEKRKDWDDFLIWYAGLLDKGEKLISVERGYDMHRHVAMNEKAEAKIGEVEIQHFEEPIMVGNDNTEMLMSEEKTEDDIQAVENLEEHPRQFKKKKKKYR